MISADTPIPGDPTIDAWSMLEVAHEARDRYDKAYDAADEYMRVAAMRLLLDGEDVCRVAKACGFDLAKTPAQPQHESWLFNPFGVSSGSGSAEKFRGWLGETVAEMVQEATRG